MTSSAVVLMMKCPAYLALGSAYSILGVVESVVTIVFSMKGSSGELKFS